MKFSKKAILFFATGGSIGNIPFAPGTFGSAAGLILCFFLSRVNLPVAAGFTVLFFFFAVFIAHKAQEILQKKDPGCIVIDEMAGIVVTLLGLPFSPVVAISGFLVFRVLDIIKPIPIGTLDKRLSGGIGIVMDDIVAGIIGNLTLRFAHFLGVF